MGDPCAGAVEPEPRVVAPLNMWTETEVGRLLLTSPSAQLTYRHAIGCTENDKLCVVLQYAVHPRGKDICAID